MSVGYEAELDPTPGVWMGQPYDAVQRRITPNHIAIVGPGAEPVPIAPFDLIKETPCSTSNDGNSVTMSPEMFSAVLTALGMDPANLPQTLELCGHGPQDPGATMDKAPAAPAPAAKVDSMDVLQARLDSLQAQLAAKPDETKIRESVRNRIKLESTAEAHGVRFDSPRPTTCFGPQWSSSLRA